MTIYWIQAVTAAIAIGFGVISVLLTLSSATNARHEAQRITRVVQDQALTSALATSDIAHVGRLLKNSLEQVSIFQYVHSSAVANRADSFLKYLTNQVSLDPRLEVSFAEET